MVLLFAACGDDDSAEPSGDAAVVTGEIAFADGSVDVATFDGATLTVRLEDISIADAPSTVLDEQTVDVAGDDLPVDFELGYEPGEIDDRDTYSVSARIEAEGQLLFISDTVVPVITRGAPTSDVEVQVVAVGGS